MEPLIQPKPIDPLNGIPNKSQKSQTDDQSAAVAAAAVKYETKQPDPQRKRASPHANTEHKGTIFQLGLIIASAALLATLFTAWTPGRPNMLFSGSSNQTNLIGSPQPSPTLQPGAPTATLKNPRLIGIVAGHWKNDSGAVCADGLKEVDINLDIATRVQKILFDEGYQVDLLNEFDQRLEGYQAAALISIHNDSCEFINNEATGFKVAAAFATHHPERSARLTACLRARYSAATKLPVHSTSVTPDMSSYHVFDEIEESTPASIIETGFMNLDRAFLTQHSDLAAQGVADGILCYMRNESVSTAPMAQPTTPVP